MIREAEPGVRVEKPEVVLFLRARKALETLRTDYGFKASPDEGLFPAEFARDELTGLLQLWEVAKVIPLPFLISDAKKVLRSLASWQGKEENPLEDQEPGRIGHEHWVFKPDKSDRLQDFKRTGRVIRENGQNAWPEMFYYGAADSTLLWTIVLDEVIEASGDQKFKEEMLPHFYRGMEWAFKYGGLASKRFIYFDVCQAPRLKFQGWRDSANAIQNRDKTFPHGQLDVDYIQGLGFKFLQSAARIIENEDPKQAKRLVERAEKLKEDFNCYFWQPEENYFVEALDEEGRPVGDLSSSPAEILWTGIVEKDLAEKVIARVREPDFWTPYGIRTISSNSPNFDLADYQKGNIWPQANERIFRGFLLHGFLKEACELRDNNLAAFAYFSSCRENWTYKNGDLYPGTLSQANELQFWSVTALLSFLAHRLSLQERQILSRIISKPLEKTLELARI